MGENTSRVSGLLFADDTTLMTESESNLQRYVRVCESRKLKINKKLPILSDNEFNAFNIEFQSLVVLFVNSTNRDIVF